MKKERKKEDSLYLAHKEINSVFSNGILAYCEYQLKCCEMKHKVVLH
jgi:hypothetical protein